MITTRSRVADVVVEPVAQPALSVVMVTYGTGGIVVDALRALVARTPPTPFEVIVVDNACPGGMPTAVRLRLATRGVRLVVSSTNLGFGGGNEAGIAAARGEVLCLLNPDAIVTPGWIEPLLAAVADPAVGIAAPVLLDPDGSVQEAGQLLDADAITAPSRQRPPAGTVADVTYSSAACWVMRRATRDRVGGFDPSYHPAYFEDVDYALRVHQAGLRTVVVADSEVVHHSGTSTRVAPPPALAQQRIFRRRWESVLAGLRAG